MSQLNAELSFYYSMDLKGFNRPEHIEELEEEIRDKFQSEHPEMEVWTERSDKDCGSYARADIRVKGDFK